MENVRGCSRTKCCTPTARSGPGAFPNVGSNLASIQLQRNFSKGIPRGPFVRARAGSAAYLAEVVLEIQEGAVPTGLPDHLQAQGLFLVNDRQVEETAPRKKGSTLRETQISPRAVADAEPGSRPQSCAGFESRGFRRPGLSAPRSRLFLAPLQGLSALRSAPRLAPPRRRRVPARPPAAPTYVSPSSVSCWAQVYGRAGGSRGCRRISSSSCTSCLYSSSFMESSPLSWRSSGGSSPPCRSLRGGSQPSTAGGSAGRWVLSMAAGLAGRRGAAAAGAGDGVPRQAGIRE